MPISAMLLPEFDQEMANTRKTLERVPEGKPDFRPHPKSMTLARLAGHVAEIPMWAAGALTTDSFDRAPPGGAPFEALVMKSRKQVLEAFDSNVAAARKALEVATDELLGKPWALLRGGQTILKMPRLVVLRTLVLNHLIHHRAQLGVYLRMNDVPVPSIYGPSADEGGF